MLTRRSWLTAAAVGVSAVSCRRHHLSGFDGYALVATAGDNSLAAIDLLDFRVLRPIALDAPPLAVLACPDGDALVMTPASGSVHRIGNQLEVSVSARLSSKLSAIALAPGGRSFFAITPDASALISGNASTLAVERRFPTRAIPSKLQVFGSIEAPMVALSSGSTGNVELIDVRTGSHWLRSLGMPVGEIQFRVDGQLLIVASPEGRSLLALSVPKLEVMAELPLAMRPDNLCFNFDGGQLFVSGEGMDGVAIVFPYRVMEVDQTVLAGRDPGVMACSQNPALLFVASASGSDVCILHVDSRRVVALVDVAQHPAFITVTPDDQYALILSKEAGAVGFIHIPSVRINPAIARSKSGAALFTMLPVGREPVHAAVIPRRS